MCGRFVHDVPFPVLAEWMKGNFDSQLARAYEPRWNISPTSTVLGMHLVDGERMIGGYRWGLVPPWAKEIKSKYPTHNARVETVAHKATFKGAYAKGQRTLIPASGYYEWQVLGDGPKPEKQPWYITAAGEPQMAFAGLYDWWRPWGSDEPWLASCTVITTTPGVDVTDIHDRQPVVILRDKWDVWLNPETDIEEAHSLLVPAPAGTFERRAVGKAVGNSRSEGASLIEPVELAV